MIMGYANEEEKLEHDHEVNMEDINGNQGL